MSVQTTCTSQTDTDNDARLPLAYHQRRQPGAFHTSLQTMDGLSAASSVVSLAVVVFQLAKSLRDNIKLVRLFR
jgi:hypothetical protein